MALRVFDGFPFLGMCYQKKIKQEVFMIDEKVVPLQCVRIKGVVTKVTQFKRREDDAVLFQSHVTVPAPDLLSHPVTYGINGEYPVGNLDVEVDVICQVGSYQRSTDKGVFFNYSLWLS